VRNARAFGALEASIVSIMATQAETAARASAPGKTPTGAPPRAKIRIGRLVFLGIVGLLILGGILYWATRTEAPRRYTTVPASRGSVTRAVTATGTVNPLLTIIVGTYVSGVIQEILCDYNTKVTKGQLCAKIDPRPYQTVVDQNKANLASAKAQLAKDEASLAYARLTYERLSRLVKLDSASRDAADNAKNAYDQALAQIDLDKASIAQREAALGAAQVNLDYTNIVSPVDGTVVSRNVTIGQTVAASFQTPTLFLIAADLTKMQVDTNVSESDIGGIKEGDKAIFTVEAFPSRNFPGRVLQVRQAPQTVQNVVTYDVVVGVDNPDLVLKPGMTATMRIVTDERDKVLRVPDQALRFSPTGLGGAVGTVEAARVWALRDGEAVPVAVKTGLDDDTNAEILEGDIKEGDRLITGEQRDAASRNSRPRLFGFF
jgi:HlyD family secretion protein